MKKRFFMPFWLLLLICLLSVPASGKAQARKQLTNLPTVYINTLDNSDITSKEIYKYARMIWLDGDSMATFDSLQIRGRGNSTWGMAKKPYRIKFKEKEKLMGKGHAKARNWTLMANCADKSLIRNAVTTELGDFIGMPFTPGALFVDFYLNDKYLGTYQISDQVEIRPHRVNIFDQNEYQVKDDTTNVTGGYLLEATGNGDFTDASFYSSKGVFVRIHEPDDSIVTRQKDYIKNYVQTFENALFSSDFEDIQKGYRQYVDTLSLLNWYIANEVAANPDGFWSSYFYKERNDPGLHWGPLWDNDISYCNTTRKGDVTQQLMSDVGFGDNIAKLWVMRMWQDKWFADAVGRRYKAIYDAGLTKFLLHKVDSLATLLSQSQEENYKVWDITHRYYEEINLYSTYDQYITDLKTFITNHDEFLLSTFCNSGVFSPDSVYYYRIFNKGFSSGVMDVYAAGVKEGTHVCMYGNDANRKSQQWVIKRVGNYYMLFNRISGLVMSDHYGSTPSSDFIMVYRADTADYRQLWTIVPQGHGGYYNLVNRSTGRAMNNSNGGMQNNNPIISYTSDARDATSVNRLWRLQRDTKITEPLPSSIEEETVEYALMYNPQREEIHFIAPVLDALTFKARIYSSDGRLAGSFAANETFDASGLSAGTYIVSWVFAGKLRSTKFLKK
jgi:hypothetical protein